MQITLSIKQEGKQTQVNDFNSFEELYQFVIPKVKPVKEKAKVSKKKK